MASSRSALAPSRSDTIASRAASAPRQRAPVPGSSACASARGVSAGAGGAAAAGGAAGAAGAGPGPAGSNDASDGPTVGAGQREVHPGARLAAGHHQHDPVAPGGELEREVHQRREEGREGAAHVHRRAVHHQPRRELRPERDEVAAAAREGHVGGEGEHVAAAGLAVERGGAVGRAERAGGRGGPPAPPRDRGRDLSAVRRDGRVELEGVEVGVGAGQAPGGDGAVLPAQRRDRVVIALDLGGGDARHPRAVGGEAVELPAPEQPERAGVHLGRPGRGRLGQLGQAPERDQRERVGGRGLHRAEQLADLELAVEGAAGQQRRAEAGPRVVRAGGRHEQGLGAGEVVPLQRGEPLARAAAGADAGGAPADRRSRRRGRGEEGGEAPGAEGRPGHRDASADAAGATRTFRESARSSRAVSSRKAA